MKKILYGLLAVLLLVLFLEAFYGTTIDEVANRDQYAADTSEFSAVVEHNGRPDLSTIKIIREGVLTDIEVTPDMIVGETDTGTVGQKELIIAIDGKRLKVPYVVKYKVTYMVDDVVIKTEYVLSNEDLIPPEAPQKQYYDFVGWGDLSQGLSGNTVFKAQYVNNLTPPAVETLKAEYEDTLAKFTLPENTLGKWVFKDAPTTPVGEIGKNTFDIEFISNFDDVTVPDSTVTVDVSRKRLEFNGLVTDFVYDGTAHFPTYTLERDVKVVATGEPVVNVGTYAFELAIVDDHYVGDYIGTFTVNKASAVINVANAYITYDQLADFSIQYSVTSSISTDLLGIKPVMPEVNGSGQYPLTVNVSNPNVDFTINAGTLTVDKLYMPDNPIASLVLGNAIYGNTLESVTFSTHANGEWSWLEPERVINQPGSFTAVAVYTPFNTDVYYVEQHEITLTVLKKVLTVQIVSDSYVYDGTEKDIVYNIVDENGVIYTGITVDGVFSQVDAGSYVYTLVINDERYSGTANGELVISPKQVEKPTVLNGAIYGDTLASVGLSDVEGGVWVWASNEAYVGGAGVRTHTAKFIPVNGNYVYLEAIDENTTKKNECTLEVSVAKKVLTFDVTIGEGNTVFTYTGAPISAKYRIMDGTALITLPLNVVGNYEYTTVGTYNITLTLVEDNYHAEPISFTLVINKKDSDVELPTGLEAIYGDKLSSVTLPDGWSWDNPDQYVGNAGDDKNNSYSATYTPSDSTNFNTLTANLAVKVNKKDIEIPSYTTVYNGQKQFASIVSDLYIGASNNGGTDAGVYNVALKITNSNYKWAGYAADVDTVNTTFTIAKASDNAFTEAPAVNGSFVYGDVITVNKGAAKYGSIVIEYLVNGVWQTEMPRNAGTYTVRFSVIETDSYNGISTTDTLVIEKATVRIPTINNTEYTYTGNIITPAISYDSVLSAVIYPDSTVVGNYTAKVQIIDPDNYKWADGTVGDTINLDYAVTKATVTPPVIGSVTYDGKEKNPNFNNGIYSYNYTAVNAGTHKVTVTLLDTHNYIWASQTEDTATAEITVDFIINKATVIVPTINKTEYVYTGSIINPNVSYNDVLSYVTYPNSTVVGDYVLTVTLTDPDNYIWADYREDDAIDLGYSITKASVTVNGLDINDWTYGQSAAIPVPSIKDTFVKADHISYTYYKADGTALAGVPANAGSYYVVMTVSDGDTNFVTAVSDKVYFTINKANDNFNFTEKNEETGETEITGSVSGTYAPSFTYSNEEEKAALEKELNSIQSTSGGKITFTIIRLDDEAAMLSLAAEDDVSLLESILANITETGRYLVILSTPESENYNAGTLSFELVVEQAENGWISEPADKLDWTYGNPVNEPDVNAIFGTDTLKVVYKDKDGNILTSFADIRNAGTYTITYTIEETANYTGLYKETTVEIYKAIVALPEAFESQTYRTEGYQGNVSEELYFYRYDLINVGTHYVDVTLVDAHNYEWAEENRDDVTYSGNIIRMAFIITKAENSWTNGEPTINGWTYGDNVTEPIFSSAFGTVNVTYTDESGNVRTFGHVTEHAGNYTAVYSVIGNDNYTSLTTEPIEFTVNKANDVLTLNGVAVPDSFTFTYGDAESFDTIVAKINSIVAKSALSVEISVAKDGQTLDDLYSIEKAVGTYTVTLKVKGNNNYNAISEDISITVTKAANGWITNPGVRSFTYGASGTLASYISMGKAKDGTISVTVYNAQGEIITVTNACELDAGEYKAVFTIENSNNFTEAEDCVVNFTVSKKQINKPTLNADEYIYNKSEQTVITDGEGYDLSGHKNTNAGNYTASITLGSNYIWSDGTEDNFTLDYTIKTIKVTVPAFGTVTYDKNTTYSATNAEDDVFKYSYSIHNAGTHVIEVTLNDADNYEWIVDKDRNDYTVNGGVANVNFVINKKSIAKPTLNATKYTYRYTISLTGGITGIEQVVINDGEGYALSGHKNTNAGKYTASINLNSNYIWDDGTTANFTLDYEIEKAKVVLPTSNNTHFYYTGERIVPEYTYEAILSIATEPTVATDVGSYSVTVTLADTDNFIWKNDDTRESWDLDYYIIQATNTWKDNVEPEINDWMYGDDEVTVPAFEATFGGEASVTYTEDGVVRDLEYVMSHAGIYSAQFSIAGNRNYTTITKTVEFEVKKRTVELPESFGEEYFKNDNYIFTTDSTLYYYAAHAFFNAGTHYVDVILNDYDNYEWLADESRSDVVISGNTATMKFVINKAGNYWTESATVDTNWTFGTTGSKATASAKFGEVIIKYYQNGTEIDFEDIIYAGDYTVTFEVVESDNYYGIDVETLTMTVKKQPVPVPETLGSKDYTGSEIEFAIGSTLYTAINNTNKQTNAGSYTATLKLTDTDNYAWEGVSASAETVTVPFSINKVKNTWTTAPTVSSDFVFTEAGTEASAVSKFGTVTITYTHSDGTVYTSWSDVINKAGYYSVRFEVPETENYYALIDQSKSFTIEKKQISLPTINNATYNSNSQSATDFISIGYTVDGVYHALTAGVDYTLSGNYSATDAGSYDFTLTLNDNYKFIIGGNETNTYGMQFVIDKATIQDGWSEAPTNVSGEYTGNAIPLIPGTPAISGYTGITVEYKLMYTDDSTYTTAPPVNVGTYVVRITVAYDKNYENFVDTTHTVEILQRQVDHPSVDGVIYDGYEKDASGLINIGYTVNGVYYPLNASDYTLSGTTKATNAGSYDFTLTLNNNFKFVVNGIDTETYNLQFVIDKATIEDGWEIDPEDIEKEFNNSEVTMAPGTPAVGGYSEIIVEYKPASANDSSYTETAPKNAGTYTVRFRIVYEANYNEFVDDTHTITITSKPIDVPTINDAVHDGTVKNVEDLIVGLDPDMYSIVTDAELGYTDTAFDVGEYKTKIQLISNYKFVIDGVDSTSCVLTFNITPGTNSWVTEPTISDGKFGENLNYTYGTAQVPGDVKVEFKVQGALDSTYSESLPASVGNYTARFTVSAENYNALTKEINFTISKGTITIPTFDPTTYTGIEQQFGSSNDYYTLSGNKATAVGKYTMTATLTELGKKNYSWAGKDESVVSVDIEFEITQATDNYWTTYPTISSSEIEFGNTLTYQAQDKYNGYAVQYYVNGAWQSEAPTAIGSYKIRFSVAGNSNYTAGNATAVEYSYSITKIAPSITAWPTFSGSYYYNNIAADGSNLVISTAGSASVNGTFVFDCTKTTFDNPYVSIRFIPEDSDLYKEVTNASLLEGEDTKAQFKLTMLVAATIGETAYGSIEDALEKAVSGNTVTVTRTTIKDSTGNGIVIRGRAENGIIRATVETGVTLILPVDTSSVPDMYTSVLSGLKNTCKVTLADNVELLVKGTVNVQGEMSGGSGNGTFASATVGDYGLIVMKANSKITLNSGAKLDCMGFIMEDGYNNGSKVIANSGSSIWQPFVLHDFHGGSYSYAGYKEKITPFNQFDMPNITSEITVNYGGKIIAYGNLSANEQSNKTNIYMVGDTAFDAALDGSANDIPFIQMSSGSKMTAKYNRSDLSGAALTDPKQYINGITSLVFEGGAKTNDLKMDINIGFTIPISMKDYFFPITWRYNILLKNGDYNLTGGPFKLMPGAVLTVDTDATLTTNSMIVYKDGANATAANGGYIDGYVAVASNVSYPTNKGDAILTVNGKLIATTFGGDIYSSNPDAIIKITNSTNSSGEINATSGSSILASVSSKQTIVGKTVLYYNGNATTVNSSGKYVIIDSVWQKAITVTFTVPANSTATISGVTYTAGTALEVEPGTSVVFNMSPGYWLSINNAMPYSKISDFSSLYNNLANGYSYTWTADIAATVATLKVPKITYSDASNYSDETVTCTVENNVVIVSLALSTDERGKQIVVNGTAGYYTYTDIWVTWWSSSEITVTIKADANITVTYNSPNKSNNRKGQSTMTIE